MLYVIYSWTLLWPEGSSQIFSPTPMITQGPVKGKGALRKKINTISNRSFKTRHALANENHWLFDLSGQREESVSKCLVTSGRLLLISPAWMLIQCRERRPLRPRYGQMFGTFKKKKTKWECRLCTSRAVNLEGAACKLERDKGRRPVRDQIPRRWQRPPAACLCVIVSQRKWPLHHPACNGIHLWK